jgi:hypothetical protein
MRTTPVTSGNGRTDWLVLPPPACGAPVGVGVARGGVAVVTGPLAVTVAVRTWVVVSVIVRVSVVPGLPLALTDGVTTVVVPGPGEVTVTVVGGGVGPTAARAQYPSNSRIKAMIRARMTSLARMRRRRWGDG